MGFFRTTGVCLAGLGWSLLAPTALAAEVAGVAGVPPVARAVINATVDCQGAGTAAEVQADQCPAGTAVVSGGCYSFNPATPLQGAPLQREVVSWSCAAHCQGNERIVAVALCNPL